MARLGRLPLKPPHPDGWAVEESGRDSGRLPSRSDQPLGPMVGTRIRDIIGPIIHLGCRIQLINRHCLVKGFEVSLLSRPIAERVRAPDEKPL